MKRISLPVLITSMLLASCSPSEYQVNSPSLQEEAQSIPESEQAGYMRILGDLRWDKLTSNVQYQGKFNQEILENVLTDANLVKDRDFIVQKKQTTYPINVSCLIDIYYSILPGSIS